MERGAASAASAAARRAWVEHGPESDFPIQNLPFGVFSDSRGGPRCGTAIGSFAVDLAALADAGLLSGLPFDARAVFHRPALNAFMALPRAAWRSTRSRLDELLREGGDDALRRDVGLQRLSLRPLQEVSMHLPAEIGDYTDFYSSREHATNVGIMFRGADNALQPNWLHLPVGYHGRASSVVVTGTPVVRPRGQLQADNDDPNKGSVYGPSRLLDIELEVGAFIGGPLPALGRPLTIDEAEDHIFGLVILNDWSARDIQKWEYVPLGPFGSKNFSTTISPWVVTLDALEPFRCATSAGRQDPEPLPYLRDPNYSSYNINLEVDLTAPSKTANGDTTTTIARSNFRNLYWSVRQQLVHHAVTGCNMRPGDLLGSGTISGKDQGSFGSMLELTWRGRDEIKLADGSIRKFLADYDSINLRGYCVAPDGQYRIGFGRCEGQILPAGVLDGERPAPAATKPLAYHSFVLHSYWRSSSSWRVRIALAHHGLSFSTKPVHLLRNGGEQLAEGYRAEVNAMAQVPALRFSDAAGFSHTITQSLAIIDFLDAVAVSAGGSGAPPLVPAVTAPEDALRRQRALEIAEIINSGIQPLQNLSVLKAVKGGQLASGQEVDGRGLAASVIRNGLAACERLVALSAGRYCAGDFVSVADVCLVPQLYSARRFEVDLSAFPNLLRVEAALSQLPSFQIAHPDRQPDAEKAP